MKHMKSLSKFLLISMVCVLSSSNAFCWWPFAAKKPVPSLKSVEGIKAGARVACQVLSDNASSLCSVVKANQTSALICAALVPASYLGCKAYSCLRPARNIKQESVKEEKLVADRLVESVDSDKNLPAKKKKKIREDDELSPGRVVSTIRQIKSAAGNAAFVKKSYDFARGTLGFGARCVKKVNPYGLIKKSYALGKSAVGLGMFCASKPFEFACNHPKVAMTVGATASIVLPLLHPSLRRCVSAVALRNMRSIGDNAGYVWNGLTTLGKCTVGTAFGSVAAGVGAVVNRCNVKKTEKRREQQAKNIVVSLCGLVAQSLDSIDDAASVRELCDRCKSYGRDDVLALITSGKNYVVVMENVLSEYASAKWAVEALKLIKFKHKFVGNSCKTSNGVQLMNYVNKLVMYIRRGKGNAEGARKTLVSAATVLKNVIGKVVVACVGHQ